MDSTMDKVVRPTIEVARKEKVAKEAKEEAIKSVLDERKQAHESYYTSPRSFSNMFRILTTAARSFSIFDGSTTMKAQKQDE
nr:hypothetical protein [Tanacetum cinerariifolium]